ncbi:hypothetical protein E4U54_003106, partial [Claviceps lovelessii]
MARPHRHRSLFDNGKSQSVAKVDKINLDHEDNFACTALEAYLLRLLVAAKPSFV